MVPLGGAAAGGVITGAPGAAVGAVLGGVVGTVGGVVVGAREKIRGGRFRDGFGETFSGATTGGAYLVGGATALPGAVAGGALGGVALASGAAVYGTGKGVAALHRERQNTTKLAKSERRRSSRRDTGGDKKYTAVVEADDKYRLGDAICLPELMHHTARVCEVTSREGRWPKAGWSEQATVMWVVVTALEI